MAGFRRFKIVLGIFIPIFAFFVMSQNTFAASIPTLYNVSYQRQINNGSWGTEQLGTTSLPYSVGGGLYYSTNFKVRNLQGTFNVPSSSVLAYDLTFNFDLFAWNGNAGAISNLCSNIAVDLTPTDGSLVTHNSYVSSCTSNGVTANVTVRSTGSYNVQTTISTFYWSISNNDNYLISCSNSTGSMSPLCGTSSNSGYWGFGDNTYYEFTGYDDPSSAFYQEQINQNNTIINQNNEMIENNQEYYDKQYDAIDNIDAQSSNDVQGAENQATTNLIGILSNFVQTITNIQPTYCSVYLNFPEFAGGRQYAYLCQGRQMQIVNIFSSVVLVTFFIPLAFVLLKMIYNEIRSWTNG